MMTSLPFSLFVFIQIANCVEITLDNCQNSVENFNCQFETFDLGLTFQANCQWEDRWENVGYSISYRNQKCHTEYDPVYNHHSKCSYEEEIIYLKQNRIAQIDTKDSFDIRVRQKMFKKFAKISISFSSLN